MILELIAGLFFGYCQAVLGVGVVLFGVPFLVHLGYDYFEALAIALPASIFASVLTCAAQRSYLKASTMIWCLLQVPFLIIAFNILISNPELISLAYVLIIAGLLLTMMVRLEIVPAHAVSIKPYVLLPLAGFLHGFASQGGAVLLFYSAVREATKEVKLATVAFAYLILCSSQYAYLWMQGDVSLSFFPYLVGTVFSVWLTNFRDIFAQPSSITLYIFISCVLFNIWVLIEKIL